MLLAFKIKIYCIHISQKQNMYSIIFFVNLKTHKVLVIKKFIIPIYKTIYTSNTITKNL